MALLFGIQYTAIGTPITYRARVSTLPASAARECDFDVCAACWAAPPKGTPTRTAALITREAAVGLADNTLSPLTEATAATGGAQQARAAAANEAAAKAATAGPRRSSGGGTRPNYQWGTEVEFYIYG